MARYKLPRTAAELLQRGFVIFPIAKGTKDWILVAWGSEATREPAKIEAWAKEFPGCNWGIALGPSGFSVIDVDVHNGQQGPETYALLELSYGQIPPTLTAATPSGGFHYFFKGSCGSINHAMAKQLGVKKTGVDIKSRGGYVVGVGSKTEVGAYSWVSDRPMANLPGWVDSLTGQSYEGRGTAVLVEDEDADVARACRWLKLVAPPSVEGEGGHDNAYRVACTIRDMGLSEDASLEAMLDNWNDRCEPPWGTAELAGIVRNAHKYARSDQGSTSAVNDFDEDLPDVWDDKPAGEAHGNPETGSKEAKMVGIEADGLCDPPAIHPVVEELNELHSKVLLGGKYVVFAKENDETGQALWVPLQRTEFDALYEHRRVMVGDKSVAMGKFWRENHMHMRSSQVVIDPALPPGPNGMNRPFNLWAGLAIKPKPAPWPRIKEVVEKALCSNDTGLSRYVLDWIAYLFQKPTEPARVALVFRGLKGTGKSTLATMLMRAFGQHAMQVSDVEEITGRFNWHLRNKVMLVAEETKWMKGKGTEGALKSLITDPMRSYEAKGLARVQGKNCCSLIMNSNEDWVVPASMKDERRFVVADVSDCYRNDHLFWREVYAEIEGEGLAGFIHDMLNRDLSEFLPWIDAPKTQALADQILESMDFMARWWHGVLEKGELPNLSGMDAGADWGDNWREGKVAAGKDLLYEDYRAMVPSRYQPKQRRVVGKFLVGLGALNRQLGSGPDRGKRVWIFPRLDEARSLFSAAVGAHAFDEDDIFS